MLYSAGPVRQTDPTDYRMPTVRSLLDALADGRFHSGSELARRFGVSRAAVWKAVQRLAEAGVTVDAVRGRGYRLRSPYEPLDAAAIAGDLVQAGAAVPAMEVLTSVDSTNLRLLQYAREGGAAPRVCLAERQTAGRGRRGRRWHSPFGANLYMSVLWSFNRPAGALGPLGLVAGLALAEALETAGLRGHGLKWPNDIYWGGRKLAGILLELAPCEADGPCPVVIGIGLNVAMPQEQARGAIDQPWVDLATALGGRYPSRNRLASLILQTLMPALQDFGAAGLAPFLPRWRRLDLVAGKPVELHRPDGVVQGCARGIDEHGRLVLEVDGRSEAHAAGEVSLRLSP